jgi:hypothetical protein
MQRKTRASHTHELHIGRVLRKVAYTTYGVPWLIELTYSAYNNDECDNL